MSAPAENEVWLAVIAEIENPAKRAFALRFLDRLKSQNPDPQSMDCLYGIIVLFDGFGKYMSKLPQRIQAEIDSGLIQQIQSVSNQISRCQGSQSLVEKSLTRVTERTMALSENVEMAVKDVHRVSTEIVAKIDVVPAAAKLSEQLRTSCLEPFGEALRKLTQNTSLLENANREVEASLRRWRRLHVALLAVAIFVIGMAVSGFLFSRIFFRVVTDMDRENAANLAQQIRNMQINLKPNGEVLEKMAAWGMKLEVVELNDRYILRVQPVDLCVHNKGQPAELYFHNQYSFDLIKERKILEEQRQQINQFKEAGLNQLPAP